MLNRCSEKKLITFNIQYITAFLIEFTHSFFFGKTSTSLVQRSISKMHKYCSSAKKKRQRSCILRILQQMSCLICFPCWAVERIPADRFSVIREKFGANFNNITSITSRTFHPDRGNDRPALSTYQTLCELAAVTSESRQVLWVYATAQGLLNINILHCLSKGCVQSDRS